MDKGAALADTRLERSDDERVDWVTSIPFILMHLAPLGILWTGFGWTEALVCLFLYYSRVFFITGGYHRYFAHRGFKTSRVMQFLLAFGGATAAQKGVLWWSGHHRHHHKYSDMQDDVHSPRKGFWWSHVGWIVCKKWQHTPIENIKDFAKYPELRWLNRHFLVPPALLGVTVWLVGGWSWLFGGFFLSTVLLYHGTFLVNSLAHVVGRRRYATKDTSKNSLVIALLTLGEGWHNNHHYYQSTANNGFFWWEIDGTFYALKVMSWVGLVWDLRTPPKHVLESNLVAELDADGEPELV